MTGHHVAMAVWNDGPAFAHSKNAADEGVILGDALDGRQVRVFGYHSQVRISKSATRLLKVDQVAEFCNAQAGVNGPDLLAPLSLGQVILAQIAAYFRQIRQQL